MTPATAEGVWSAQADISLENKILLSGPAHAGSCLNGEHDCDWLKQQIDTVGIIIGSLMLGLAQGHSRATYLPLVCPFQQSSSLVFPAVTLSSTHNTSGRLDQNFFDIFSFSFMSIT